MRRIRFFVLATAAAIQFTTAGAAHQQPPAPSPRITCDEASVKPDSYRLTTEAQALNVLRPREPWWEAFGVWNRQSEIGGINQAAVRLAERAKELDDHNLLAHGYLARQYVVLAIDARKAEDEWRRVIDHGGAIVWTASLYDLDPRSFFVFAFDPRGIRIFRFSQLAGELRTHFGVPEFPEPDRVEFWRALGGCLQADAAPEAEIAWARVRELRATTWTLRFELRDQVSVGSDRGKRRTDDTLEVNLHPRAGEADFRFGMTPFGWGPHGRPPVGADPGAYHQRVKQMLETFFGPQMRVGSE